MNTQKKNLPKEYVMCGNEKGGFEMNTCQVIDENRNNFIKSYSFDNRTIVCQVMRKIVLKFYCQS